MNGYRATDSHVYRSDECIGRGATGDVHRGYHKVTGEQCALKLCDPRFSQQLQREVEAMRQLQHPNITKFFQLEHDIESRRPVLVMELCEKGNLLEVLREPQHYFGLEEDEFLRFFRHLVSGMKHLRQNGFSHRDIKPGNILVCISDDGSYIYKLSDFGTAKPLKDGDFFQSLVGTEEYLHPDIFKAAFIDRYRHREFDISVDLWSLGATLYHAATGKVPFQPYQGRGDKHTMFQMITHKETGVISGEQTTAGGDISWSKELPKTCSLSKYMKRKLTEFLVRLLESQTNKMWTFDGFFVAADELLKKQRIHTFSVVDGETYKIYVDPDKTFPDLKNSVNEQMDHEVKSPYFLLHGRDLFDTLSESDFIRSYPVTTEEDPIVVLPLQKCSTSVTRLPVDSCVSLVNEIKPRFMDGQVDREDDYKSAKKMCVVAAMILKAIKKATTARNLFSRTSSDCRYETRRRFVVTKKDKRYAEDRFRDIKQIVDTDKKKSTLLFTTITEKGEIADDDLLLIQKKVNSCTASIEDCSSKLDQLDQLTKIINSQGGENYNGIMERTFHQIEDVMQRFQDNRRKPTANYHERKFHQFDKTSMTNRFNEANACLKKVQHALTTTFTTFKRWHSSYVCVLESLEETEISTEEISCLLKELVQNLKGVKDPPMPSIQKPSIKQRKLAEEVNTSVLNIKKDMTESKQIAEESREQMYSLSSLVNSFPDDLVLECDL